VSKYKIEKTTTLPSGYVGVYRARGGRWEACVADVVKGKPDLISLGVYATRREAAVARAKYWKAKERQAA
jgi:hypothetical protein